MSIESKICRTYLDVAEITKNRLVTAILENKEKNNFTAEQINALVVIINLTCDQTTDAGLSALQKIASLKNVNAETEVKEVVGKKKTNLSKSEAA